MPHCNIVYKLSIPCQPLSLFDRAFLRKPMNSIGNEKTRPENFSIIMGHSGLPFLRNVHSEVL
jgi:hypothetical protein